MDKVSPMFTVSNSKTSSPLSFLFVLNTDFVALLNLSLCLTEEVGLARGKEGQMNLYLKSKVKTSVSTA